MNRRRYIPLAVRVQVAERQLMVRGCPIPAYILYVTPLRERLRQMLRLLFGDKPAELHHRPALVNRPLNRRKTDTVPPANDPDYLVYLLKDEEHRIETFVRGVGAQRSDVSQRRYNKRVAKNRAKRPRVANASQLKPGLPPNSLRYGARRPYTASTSQ